ncbi:hypothetical protein GobsT_53180 [Gemmata obscuriglobus]|nr:hypothetical protein GobsT_53180 [Gemmata obscuriglobus]
MTLTVGDAPEKFQLCHSGPQALAAEKPFRECMFGETLIGVEDLDRCSESGWWWRPDYTVTELFDGVLSYSRSAAPPFHGSDGYFLWHLFASLALVAPLSEPSFRELVLQGCERVYLLSGSGSLFVYLATVTKEGMQYERP